MNRQQRRRRRKIRRIIATAVLVVLAVVVTLGVMRLKTLMMFNGSYVRNVDITDSVVALSTLWLSDVDGVEIDTERIRNAMGEISVEADIDFDMRFPGKGTFVEELDAESYGRCRDRAVAAVGECLEELIRLRLENVGYAQELSDEDTDALITEALGMTLDNYLKNSGIEIMPGYDELAAGISRTGEYRIKGNTIEWERDGSQVREAFSAAKGSIALTDEGDIYRRAGEREPDKGKDDQETVPSGGETVIQTVEVSENRDK